MKRLRAWVSAEGGVGNRELGAARFAAAAGLIASVSAAGCAGGAASDALQVESAIERAQSGELVERINEGQEKASAAGEPSAVAASGLGSSTESAGSAITSADLALVFVKAAVKAKAGGEFEPFGLERYNRVKPAKDPCPAVKKSAAGLDEDGLAAQAVALGACLRPMLRARAAYASARDFLKGYELPSGAPLSKRSPSEIEAYLRRAARSAGDGARAPVLGGGAAPAGARAEASALKLRGAFGDEALADLRELAELSFKSLLDAESAAVAAAEARPGLIAALAKEANRYALLEATTAQFDDLKGEKLAKATLAAITGETPKEELAALIARFPVAMLHAYNVLALVPDEGAELADLKGSGENPLLLMLSALGSLEGPVADVERTVKTYRMAREIDNPSLPAHAQATSAQAVRVAVMDTGVDFRNYGDLGLFLGLGRRGELASYDYADGDPNPWALGIGGMSHGTGTAATVLTMVARAAPEVLRARRFELASWKIQTVREMLSGGGAGSYANRAGFYDAIVRNVSAEVKPKIVSVSLAFRFAALNKLLGKDPGVLRKAPWLWVMAAGNESSEVTEHAAGGRESECFADVDPKDRDDARILCVGALIQGIVNDEVAAYSNFGPRVDVYAYESYTKLCPNGTSCSTPAVAGAAAAIAAKYPALSPEGIKKAIVAAAEMRTLSKQADPDLKAMSMAFGLDLPPEKTVTVPVFDPATMMERALREAGRLSDAAPHRVSGPAGG